MFYWQDNAKVSANTANVLGGILNAFYQAPGRRRPVRFILNQLYDRANTRSWAEIIGC
jgi:hypothetical protein